MSAAEETGEVVPPRLHHVMSGRQFRLVVGDGRVVVAEGGGESWFVYIEDEPSRVSGGSFDGLVIAEVLGYPDRADYPDPFDEWADQVKAAAPR